MFSSGRERTGAGWVLSAAASEREDIMRAHSVAVAAFAVAVVGCASGTGTVRMTTNGDIPAAQGTAKASPASNGNTALEVDVKHLAPPGRVVSGATTYVVWVHGKDGEGAAQNVGALRVDGELRGTLNTVTPLRTFELFITAEPSSTISAPTGKQLLSASVQRHTG